jgi:hypothetical protein
MKFTEHLESIAAEIETASEAHRLRDDQIAVIDRQLDAIGQFTGPIGDTSRRFRESLDAHHVANLRHDPDAAELCYVHVREQWDTLLPLLETFAREVNFHTANLTRFQAARCVGV